jgi:hypothetical protein
MMVKVEELLHRSDSTVLFHHVGNRIWYVSASTMSDHTTTNQSTPARCFAHVINIAVQHILAELKNNYNIDYLLSLPFDASLGLESYGDALKGDLVGHV